MVRPVTVHEVVAVVHESPDPSEAAKEVTADPPSEAGAVQETVAEAFPPVAVTAVGTPGVVGPPSPGETVIFSFADLVAAVPVAVRVILYLFPLLVEVLAGNRRICDTAASEQSKSPPPASRGTDDDKEQVVALATVAVMVEEPPGVVIVDGVAKRSVMTGFGVLVRIAPAGAAMPKVPSSAATAIMILPRFRPRITRLPSYRAQRAAVKQLCSTVGNDEERHFDDRTTWRDRRSPQVWGLWCRVEESEDPDIVAMD